MVKAARKGEQPYLYLATIGRRSGLPREIEIWFTCYEERYYVLSCLFEKGQWVMNLRENSAVEFCVGNQAFKGSARVLDAVVDEQTCGAVKSLSDQKYGWSDGLVVELIPNPGV